MLRYRTAIVTDILSERPGCQEIEARTVREELYLKAINYTDLTGPVALGDKVLLNSTATALKLGTGGYDFVLCNLTAVERNPEGVWGADTSGHLMKLRYTPLQFACLSVEEPASPFHPLLLESSSLEGKVVIACELLSQAGAVLFALRQLEPQEKRIVLVVTDTACLPVAFSHLIQAMREEGWFDGVITCGQAFGGDVEAVHLVSGLLSAKAVFNADFIVVTQGPGNAGTRTPYGFSGLSQAEALNSAGALGGIPVAVLRASQADPRPEHYGLSWHTKVILQRFLLTPCWIPVPSDLDFESLKLIRQVLQSFEATEEDRKEKLILQPLPVQPLLEAFSSASIPVTSMGRTPSEDPLFFGCALSAGRCAVELLRKAPRI